MKEEEDGDKERQEQKEISLLLSKCHSLLEQSRRTVAEARIGFFTRENNGNENKNENKNEDVNDDGRNEKKKKRDAAMTESLERTIEECSATVAEIERRVLVFANNNNNNNNNNKNNKNETKIVLVFKTETRTIQRELEEVRKHLASFKCDDEKRRIPPLIPEPQKDASRKEREDIVREALHEEKDQFVYWKKSAKMYLEKAKKKMDSVATKTKTAVKKFAATTAATTTTTTTKNEERYSDAQRQRERREEEEIRRLRRYGYENATTNNNTGEHSVFEGNLDEKNVEEKEDDDDSRRKALFATITPTVTTMTSSLPNNNNNDNNNNRYTDNTRYDINVARNSTLAANRSAIALEGSLKQAERAEQAGRDTLENLRRQRETLQRTSAQMQNAKDTVEENRKIVKKMSHWSRLGC
ncbi:unnamed protein product [Bathycoccus prasinos]